MKEILSGIILLVAVAGNAFADNEVIGHFELIGIVVNGTEAPLGGVSAMMVIENNGKGTFTETFSLNGKSCSITAATVVTYLDSNKLRLDEGSFVLSGGDPSVSSECQRTSDPKSDEYLYRFESGGSILIFESSRTTNGPVFSFRFKKL